MDNSEDLWLQDKERHGWVLPPQAHWFFRLPLIRNIRGAWVHMRIEHRAEVFMMMGIGLGQPNQYDLWVVYAIKRGWC